MIALSWRRLGLAYVTRCRFSTDLQILWLTALALSRASSTDAVLARSIPGDAKNA
jgi:hypothetical protein